jgi:hypothetical protein
MWYTWGKDKKYKVLVGKPEEKRLFRRLVCRWDDDVRMDLRETRCEYVDWTHLIQDRVQWWTPTNMAKNR